MCFISSLIFEKFKKNFGLEVSFKSNIFTIYTIIHSFLYQYLDMQFFPLFNSCIIQIIYSNAETPFNLFSTILSYLTLI
jgi:hypothetical protein